jgi:hypothetical protein
VLHASDPATLSSKELVQELISDAQLLLQRQVALTRLEARKQIKEELRMAGLVSAGGLVCYAASIVGLVAAALAIGEALGHLWLGALIVSGVLLVLAALVAAIGWSLRVREPLPRSKTELKREIAWARHQAAT